MKQIEESLLKELISLARDGRRLHVSNAVHDEFLNEDDEVIQKAQKLLSQPPPIEAAGVHELFIYDLNCNHGDISTLAYLQFGVKLFDDFDITKIFKEDKNIDEKAAEFYKRLARFRVIVKNITLSDKKNAYDNPLNHLRDFIKYDIDFYVSDSAAGRDVIRKISIPIYEKIKDRTIFLSTLPQPDSDKNNYWKQLIKFVRNLEYMNGTKPQGEFTEQEIFDSFKQ